MSIKGINLLKAIRYKANRIALDALDDPETDYNHIIDGASILQWALSYAPFVSGDYSILSKLIDKPDINYNHISNGGWTALIYACYYNVEFIALKLLDKPDINYKQVTYNGISAMSHALNNNMHSVIVALNKIEHGEEYDEEEDTYYNYKNEIVLCI
jgi:ankyrin repeat protein